MAQAGPDEIHAAGYQLALQPPTFRSLGDLRVAAMVNSDDAPVSQETQRRVEAVLEAIKAAGGQVDYDARPDFNLKDGHEVYQTLLWSVMASRNPDDAYNALRAQADALDPTDQSDRARTLRAQVASYRDYGAANEARTRMRWAWHEFFKTYDAFITPMMATPAFPHDHGPMGQRTLLVDNTPRPYFEQLFWAGMAVNSYLPATVIPTGAVGEGLPIGVQMIGPEFGDLKLLGMAKMLEAEGFTFIAPPGYDD
jgi:amidase